MKKNFRQNTAAWIPCLASKATYCGKEEAGRQAMPSIPHPLLTCFLLGIMLAFVLALSGYASATAPQAKKSFRIALMMDNDSQPNLMGRDNIMEELNNRAFQDGLGWKASFSYVKNAMYTIEPGPTNQDLIDAAARSLMERDDIDLIMTFCTEAAKALIRHNNKRTPIFVASGEDPEEAGISQYLGKAETKNLFISFPPDLTRNNILLLRSHLKNNSLGIIYEDSPNGELRARLQMIKKTCAEENIQLITVPMPDSSTASCEKGVATLAELNPDAFYAGSQKCLWGKKLQAILKPMTDRGIPTIGESEDQARNGAMLSMLPEPKARDKQDAHFIISILSGGKVSAPNHKLSTDIILNLSVAVGIGFTPSYALLATADKMLWNVEDDSEKGE